jgi:aspartate aminotransferase
MLMSKNVYDRMQAGTVRKWFEEGIKLKKKFGEENVYDFSLGNPITDPPSQFTKLLRELVNNPASGSHGYMQNAGYVDTRMAIARQLSKEAGVSFSENDIIMTVGAAGGLNVALKSLLNPGEEVIVFTPFFAEYANYIDNHNGVMKLVPSDEDFLPRLDILEKTLSKNSKAVIMNTPNNPTGKVYNEDFIKRITDLLKKCSSKLDTHIVLLNDEAYRKLLYDHHRFTHVYKYYPDTITVNSHSKDLALAGERIGYLTIHPDCEQHDDLVQALTFTNRTLGFVNAPALMQHVVRDLQDVTIDISIYQKKRDYLYDNLVKWGYQIIKPEGAFYMFPKTPIDGAEFCAELRNYNILAAPGAGFGTPQYFRIAYCVQDRVIEGALPGFKAVAQKLKMF